MITQAQRAAVKAADLPFVLTDAEIAAQFAQDGSTIERRTADPMQRVRALSRQAIEAACLPKAA